VFIGRITQMWISTICERQVDDNYIPKMAEVGSFETSVRSTRLNGITSPKKVVPNHHCETSKLADPSEPRRMARNFSQTSPVKRHLLHPGAENDGKLSNDRQTDNT